MMYRPIQPQKQRQATVNQNKIRDYLITYHGFFVLLHLYLGNLFQGRLEI